MDCGLLQLIESRLTRDLIKSHWFESFMSVVEPPPQHLSWKIWLCKKGMFCGPKNKTAATENRLSHNGAGKHSPVLFVMSYLLLHIRKKWNSLAQVGEWSPVPWVSLIPLRVLRLFHCWPPLWMTSYIGKPQISSTLPISWMPVGTSLGEKHLFHSP